MSKNRVTKKRQPTPGNRCAVGNRKLPEITPPDLRTVDEAIAYDFDVLKANPQWEGFVRPCFPFELPGGMYKRLSAEGRSIFFIVVQKCPGVLNKSIMTSQGDFRFSVDLRAHGIIQEIEPFAYSIHLAYGENDARN
jgi:hypothetical protein